MYLSSLPRSVHVLLQVRANYLYIIGTPQIERALENFCFE